MLAKTRNDPDMAVRLATIGGQLAMSMSHRTGVQRTEARKREITTAMITTLMLRSTWKE
jgi:hypothetical protein